MSKILVVDDDKNINKLIQSLLENENYEVIVSFDGKDALEKLDNEKVDMLITDVMMPNMDGWELCREVRLFSNMPILMLTVLGETTQKVKGFVIGADDYLTKPFEPIELIARVKALFRRANINDSMSITVGNLVIDKNSYIVKTNSENFTLPPKEFELLFALASTPSKTFSRDSLIEDIWGYDFDGNERTLDVHIGRIRDRFPQEQFGIKITTIRGLSYRLEETSEKTK
ncbi:response regulator transcription factor [Clostridium saccharobutylicum]|uniref:Heme response regulator HssR n=1 Tax=Clostridium saccharobutylicum DSM 13864 TaxID=1345695 RepID=U5MUM8_CLOSA|nr:response regulator transcription factor [Clostridium saccharobutylicum]AGX43147.1 heme response regulator HssR [Clostridium saccharobutylicum DSM 13864]AQR90444.1 heme response regulator HssR [Clostridium saccharobutylicum]AQS00350.1 heme response regulator HssR [Clostridium saccharobutylicum]AQS14333.1 heme response regulator HssR [Clostridium saccharobutylicum]MBA2906615.1 DNA-binding response OmpR family regulator [Clostridium saccharobutylicum]